MGDCELLPRCGFFSKYQDTMDLACRGFMNAYCKGPKQTECSRRKYRAEHGLPPQDDMLPSGQIMPKRMGGSA